MKLGKIYDVSNCGNFLLNKRMGFFDTLEEYYHTTVLIGNVSNIDIYDDNGTFTKEYSGLHFRYVCEIEEDIRLIHRAYTNGDEMIGDYKKRFNNNSEIPTVWLKGKFSKKPVMINAFGDCTVFILSSWLTMTELYRDYTYLDGSPVGIIND